MKKRIISMLLCILLSLSASVSYANKSPEYNALPTTSKIIVDGTEVAFEAYNINGNNFFKLRDLAMALNETPKKFDILWLEDLKVISVKPNKTYTPVGGELLPGDGTIKTARITETQLDVGQCIIPMELYNINGNNFFKLRDIGLIQNFYVGWDEANNCVIIDTSKPYEN